MLNRSLVSSNSNEWATPQKFFDILDDEFHFTLDPCSSHMNCKTDKHYTINENGLLQDWSGEHVFMNPPYGYQTSQWIEKAYKESLRGAVVVCLIAARTDTSYWHDIIFRHAAQIRFIRGKIKFDGAAWNAPFASAVVVFDNSKAYKRLMFFDMPVSKMMKMVGVTD
ncbi:DNA N-6-adenine-methyltransferase [Enterocloster lavalensis]|uniref:DNA N-6-adenine-methyltransferase n=1 Tax=Enterocloster lavalensis TaxID=460384 RepID=UPI0034A21EB6